ncbi:MAG: hypothetical protein HY789_00440 [Deltaproteobacteria bacterium]|nr:hypothetical protein [Deltaproteobacteria bacterium]
MNLDLDSCALTLANCLRNDDKDYLEEFEVIPTWSSHIFSLGVMTPVKVPIEGVTYWQLYLPRFQALVKVDPGPGALCLQPLAMSDGTNLCMLEKNFTEFKETDIVKQIVIENIKKKNDKRHKKSQVIH